MHIVHLGFDRSAKLFWDLQNVCYHDHDFRDYHYYDYWAYKREQQPDPSSGEESASWAWIA